MYEKNVNIDLKTGCKVKKFSNQKFWEIWEKMKLNVFTLNCFTLTDEPKQVRLKTKGRVIEKEVH